MPAIPFAEGRSFVGAGLPAIPVAEGRCTSALSPSRQAASFNPRPPSPRGDAVTRAEMWHIKNVSIRAPRRRGAMRCFPCQVKLCTGVSIRAPRRRGAMREQRRKVAACATVSIRAPRRRGAMPGCRSWCSAMAFRFQSAPPVAEGRCLYRPRTSRVARCFNPRPPSPRGDAGGWRAGHAGAHVSICAPRRRGAMRERLAR